MSDRHLGRTNHDLALNVWRAQRCQYLMRLEFWIEWMASELGLTPMESIYQIKMLDFELFDFIFFQGELIIVCTAQWVYPVGSYLESLYRPMPQEAAPHATTG